MICLITVSAAVITAFSLPAWCGTYTVTRLNGGRPIITQSMFDVVGASEYEGSNINGPSAIRVPGWITHANRADPAAVYYLYFAHHKGNYIRLAWAADIEGPWHLYRVGTGTSVGSRGVLDLGASDSINIGNSITIYSHIASPDVFVDDTNRRILMYFHGPTKFDGSSVGQRSFAAMSPYGLDFHGTIEPVILGRSYFRVFEANGNRYAVANNGSLYKALDPNNPWTPPPGFDFSEALWTRLPDSVNPFVTDIAAAGLEPLRLRHSAVRVVGDTLDVFYSRKEDLPERLLLSTIDLSAGDFDMWDATFPPEEILHAELEWEGGHIPPERSSGGAAPENVNQLRDPCLFEDMDGTLYLLYAGCGEDALGLARLDVGESEEPVPTSGYVGLALTVGILFVSSLLAVCKNKENTEL